jgi:tRNA dimethylallyltransferase
MPREMDSRFHGNDKGAPFPLTNTYESATKSTPIPIICGPTASGKTALAVELAGRHPIEVVSADSRQIIKRLDIGTSKPSPEEREKVRFHLIDLIEPGERYTAFRFIEDAGRAIKDVLQRGHVPVVVGGTGLYLRALTEGVVEIEQDDLGIRQQLEEEMEQLGPKAMYERLSKIDRLEAARLHPNNKVRVIRALEIFYLTGKPKSELTATGTRRESQYSYQYYCLLPERQALYHTIEARIDGMMERGLLDEIRRLIQNGMQEQIKKANVIGYTELLDHLDGKATLSETISLIKQNTRRYAKRQITWFRHQTGGNLFQDAASLSESLIPRLQDWSRKSKKT